MSKTLNFLLLVYNMKSKVKKILKIILRIFGILVFITFAAFSVDCFTQRNSPDYGAGVFGGLIALVGIYLVYLSREKKEKQKHEQPQIIKCKACGAQNTINEGETKYCEYCGQLLENENKKQEKC